jgi:hypothetical protein
VSAEPIDLGHGHIATILSWHHGFDDIPDTDHFGVDVEHTTPAGRPCVEFIAFDSPSSRAAGVDEAGRWTLENVDPLTVSPSLLCACGDHGFIRSGAWVPA